MALLISRLSWPFLLLLTLQALGQEPSIRYVQGNGLQPYSYLEDGEAKGILPDMVERIFSSLDVQTHTRLIPESRTLYEMINQRADAAAVILFRNLTAEDYPSILTICPTPLFRSRTFLVWHADIKLIPGNTYDMNQYRVGLWTSSKGILEKGDVPIEGRIKFQSAESMLKSLLANRIDGAILNWNHAKFLAKKFNAEDKIQQGQFVADLDVHLAVTDSWLQTNKVSSRVCPVIDQLKKEGELQKILDRYFQP